ncbi:hypothetical protein B484DRAFT_230639 [Ochromonadaceae sp. CCMP2298]|nr:hypothetical protein B484DRAFT_230639 [Ochromonadaceae sp. CCMP2298]|mmetsp:Transcript_20201/g.44922  ORF Transcript_20201/g.44922 Transcript_20201/m.44922 type:complete len:467 (+) Transcript_20201:73-1473(+)
METGKSTYSLFESSLHGCGVRAECEIQVGDTVLLEAPLHFLQTLPNRRSVIVCTSCLRPLGSLSTQLGVLQGTVSRENIIEECANFPPLADEDDFAELMPCITGCGEMYCSEKCREHHWSYKGHKLLCTGLIPEKGAEAHPLMQFKLHAMTTNEIFLMVADVFASLCVHMDALVESGLSASQAFDVASRPLSGYCRELWWDAAITPANQKQSIFKKTLKLLVRDSYALLSQVVGLEKRGYESFLTEEYMARTVGMFEQNNVGVQMKIPISTFVEQLVQQAREKPSQDALTYINEATIQILDNVEDDGMCCEVGDEEEEEEEEGEDDEIDIPMEEDEGNTNGKAVDDDDLVSLREMIDDNGLETLYPPLDGTAFYSLICRINHSCDPNVRVVYDSLSSGGLQARLVALRPALPGDEYVQSYIDQFQPYAARQKALKDYGFECSCSKCLDESGRGTVAVAAGVSGDKS